jgi:hypothetical protein
MIPATPMPRNAIGVRNIEDGLLDILIRPLERRNSISLKTSDNSTRRKSSAMPLRPNPTARSSRKLRSTPLPIGNDMAVSPRHSSSPSMICRTRRTPIVRCGSCGRPITGERKIKRTRDGEQDYVYYRSTRYNAEGHPRSRVREEDLDQQVLAIFDRLQIQEAKVRDWFLQVLRARARETQQVDRERVAELKPSIDLITAAAGLSAQPAPAGRD